VLKSSFVDGRNQCLAIVPRPDRVPSPQFWAFQAPCSGFP
jgi:hypothetical protein